MQLAAVGPDGAHILLIKRPRQMNYNAPLGIVPDPSARVLAMILRALSAENTAVRYARGGMPVCTYLLPHIGVIAGSTPCALPMFADTVRQVAQRRRADVLLCRTGLHPEILDPVTIDVALAAGSGEIDLSGMVLYRHPNRNLWLVSSTEAHANVKLSAAGLRLVSTPPFSDRHERADGVCRAAAEIVRAMTQQGAMS